jgi:hypothetical protein
MARFPDVEIHSISDLLAGLAAKANPGKPLWFRGHSQKDWPLLPGLARKKKTAQAESTLIKGFRQNAVGLLPSVPRTEWDWLFFMQHYRLPTRLLDWTESPLVALFFVVEERPKEDGAIWCLDPVALNKNANVSFSFGVEIPAFDYDEILDNYLPSRIASETTSDLSPIAGIACRNSPRITAQLGTFTITHRNHTPIEAVGDASHVWRQIVPAADKANIRRELQLLRISRLTLFPELDQVAAHAAGLPV